MQITKPKRSLRGKLVAIMLATLAFVGVSTMTLVSWVQIRGNELRLAETERQIRDALEDKGKILSSNHALALRNLVLDNAFSDVRSLIEGAVKDDPDVVYGLFLSAENTPWAYTSPTHQHDQNGKVDPEAWKELGLGDAPTPPSTITKREVQLFGDTIHEFAVPVTDGEEVLGTVRYGVSSRRMRDALDSARERSRDTLEQTLWQLAGLVVFNSLVGLLLVFRAARRITSPLGNLTEAASRIRGGEREVTADVRSGDEIELLGNTFNQMVAELGESYRTLEGLNTSLEDKVKERTHALASRNKDMRLVMDNVQQGFITVFPDGSMAKERSAVVDDMLGPGDAESFAAYVTHTDPRFGLLFEFGLDALVADILPRELCLDQLPRRAVSGERQFQFQYVDISQGETFEGLLVVIEDVTEKLARERVEQEQAETMAVFRRIMRDRSGFHSFFVETCKQIAAIVDHTFDEDVPLFKRVIHTIKGNCGIMGLHIVAGICHKLEDDMAEEHGLPSDPAREVLAARWRVISDTAAVLFGRDDQISVTRDEHEVLVRELERDGYSDLAAWVRAWELEPISLQFQRMEEQARDLSSRLGRGDIVVESIGGKLRLDREQWAPLWASLVHLIRNCVDHGLYPADETPAGHGPPRLFLRAQLAFGRFILEVGDNGRGIDWEKIRERARRQGIPHATREDLAEALFADGVSTRDEVSETSGRGVGMSAVRATCEKLEGKLLVHSEPGKGATFTFSFPPRGVYVGPRKAVAA